MELALNSQSLPKVLLAQVQFPHTTIEHGHKAGNQSLIATQQYARGREQRSVESNQGMPGAPLHHRFMQPFLKEQITGALPAPAQTQMADGRYNRLNILQPFALLARWTLCAYDILIVDSNLHMSSG